MNRHILLSAAISSCLFLGGCQTKTQSGALIGGAAGAGAGAIIGHQSGHAGTGALIGGAVGAIGGGLVGHGMDKKDAREAREREQYQQQQHGGRGASASSSASARANTVTQNDVIAWTARGTKEDVIIDRIERSDSTFYLTSTDERDLRNAGVSPRVIDAMRAKR